MEATSKLLEVLENNISNEELEYVEYLLESIDAREWELLKYKRAFEIFTKDKELTLHKGKCPILGTNEYKISFVNWKSLTKEEYELIEELMKDE